MRPRYKVSEAGLGLIESFEGFRAKAARLADGRWTIGYGHVRSAREGAEVSPEDARILLRYVDLPPIEAAIHELVFTPLTQNQYDALTAFVFNVGVEAFGASDVLKRVNEGRLTEAACAIELWRRAEIGGDAVVLDALIRRRAAEKALFLTPPDGFVPTPSALVRPELDARAAEQLPTRRPVEHEAPLSGAEAEVRLQSPFEVEPEVEVAIAPGPEAPEAPEAELTPTAFAPEPIETSTAFAPEPGPEAAAAPEPEIPTSFTPEPALEPMPEPGSEPAAERAEPMQAPTSFEPEAGTSARDRTVAAAVWSAQVITFAEARFDTRADEAAPEEAPREEARQAEPALEEAPTAWTVETEASADEEAASGASEAADQTPAAQPAPPLGQADQAFSNYGPMAFAIRAAESTQPSEPAEAETERRPAEAPHAPALVTPGVQTIGVAGAAAPDAQAMAQAAPAPAVTADSAPPQPLVLTSPPTDWEEHRRAAPAMVTGLAAEADELDTPLFDEPWDGPSALSGRIVRHEPVGETEGEAKRLGSTGPYVLLGLIGFVAFAGALFAFWRGRAPGSTGDTMLLAWALFLIATACLAVSVYFLWKRLGGAED